MEHCYPDIAFKKHVNWGFASLMMYVIYDLYFKLVKFNELYKLKLNLCTLSTTGWFKTMETHKTIKNFSSFQLI